MDFFCVRKPRHTREKHHRRRAKKREEKTSIIRFEARPGDNPARNTERGRQTHRRSRAMAHPYPNPPHADSPALNIEQPYAYRRSQTPRPPTRSSHRDEHDANPRVSQAQAQETPQQLNQIYVHPYSSHHYRFAVVDHSTTCHGSRPVPYPAYSFALVPEVAAVQDIEGALAHHSGLAVMVRLKGPGHELIRIGAFYSIRDLYEASLQLEVCGSNNGVEAVRMPRNGREE
ncbi:hypothetical protein F5B21DRAFT_361556 [Xylaria acuta]|nr:hypothetical protein F5B21DRAFT_361556 [Xylaria acuta]